MCGLAGFFKYGINKVNGNTLIKNLLIEAQIRGGHATGIAFIPEDNKLVIEKAAKSADKFSFNVPKQIKAVMGHTRHTTQGSEKQNQNNHPFLSTDSSFALAHNGVLDNDYDLQESENLPETDIQTDSYVAVQLMEKYGNLKDMAERVAGMFTFTILTETGKLHIVKNDSPLYLVDLPDLKMYVYGSTADIVNKALKKQNLDVFGKVEHKLTPGDILTIEPNGKLHKETFKVNTSYTYNWKNFSLRRAAGGYMELEDDLRWACYDLGIYDDEFDMLLDRFKLYDIQDAIENNSIESYLLECYRDAYRASSYVSERVNV